MKRAVLGQNQNLYLTENFLGFHWPKDTHLGFNEFCLKKSVNKVAKKSEVNLIDPELVDRLIVHSSHKRRESKGLH